MLFTNLTCYRYKICKLSCLVFLSIKYGWSFITLLQGNKFLFFFNMYVLGFLRRYYWTFGLKGFGFRFLKLPQSAIIKLGLSHRLLIYVGYNMKLHYKSKYLITISSRLQKEVRHLLLFFCLYYKRFAYKRLGIFLKGVYTQLKLSKKKNKF